MSWGMVAVAGATLVSGYMGSQASKKAAKAQGDASAYAADVQHEMYETTRGDLAPYRDVGAPALKKLMYLTGLGEGSAGDPEFGSLMRDFKSPEFAFEKDPGYQFRLEEGEKALTRGAAARGLAKSTPGLKSLMRFSSGLASEEYGAAYGRFDATRRFDLGVHETNRANKFNMLSYLAGTGHNAAAMTGQAGTNAAGGMAAAAIAGGNAAAQGTLGAASSWNNAIQGGIGNFMYQRRFDEMMNRFPVFSSTRPASANAGYSIDT